jgi:alanyl-tRNA synthetase
MDTDQIRMTFVDFYRERGHQPLPGSTLVPPPGDPVLFTTSGMHPLTPYLEGRPHPQGPRLVNVQRCLRTTDLEEVGDSRHLTVFEMLGSWSLDDYSGPQSVRWGHELLCERFGLDPALLHVTVFGGDGLVGPDTESWRVWEELGVPVEPTREDNWWSSGATGPCGPDTEVFVWTGNGPPRGTPTTDDRWVEVWNHVLMRYRRRGDGQLESLERPSVDTGMGLERLAMVLQGRESVYETDLLEPWVSTVQGLWPVGSSLRLVCDHLRSAVVVVGDGVRPSSSGRGYVLRRLLRRVLTRLWRQDRSHTLSDLPETLIEVTLQHFGQPVEGQQVDARVVRRLLMDEQVRFDRLLRRGRSVVSRYRSRGELTERDLFELHDTHGLPRDLVLGVLSESEAEHESGREQLPGQDHRQGLGPA